MAYSSLVSGLHRHNASGLVRDCVCRVCVCLASRFELISDHSVVDGKDDDGDGDGKESWSSTSAATSYIVVNMRSHMPFPIVKSDFYSNKSSLNSD